MRMQFLALITIIIYNNQYKSIFTITQYEESQVHVHIRITNSS